MRALLFSVFLLFSTQSFAFPASPVKVSFQSDVLKVAPGHEFHLAVKFSIPKPWHIYWKYPGEAGLPTAVKVSSDSDVILSSVLYPVPTEFIQPGKLTGYGYDKDVTLIIPARAGDNLNPGSSINLKGSVSWLACSDICIPGSKKLSVNVPVAHESSYRSELNISELLKNIPLNAKAAEELVALEHKPETKNSGGRVFTEVSFNWSREVKAVRFYPLPEESFKVKKIRIKHLGTKTVVRASWKQPQTNPLLKGGVIEATDPAGKKLAVEFEF